VQAECRKSNQKIAADQQTDTCREQLDAPTWEEVGVELPQYSKGWYVNWLEVLWPGSILFKYAERDKVM
jgi:hypothetical protein